MIKVIDRDKVWEVPGWQTVRDVFLPSGMTRPPYSPCARQAALDSELLDEDDEVKLIAIISGG